MFVNGTPVRLLQARRRRSVLHEIAVGGDRRIGAVGVGMLTYFYGLADLAPAYADSPWLRVLSVERDADRREIRFAFDANPDPSPRIGSIMVAGKPFTVLQHPGIVTGIP